MARYYMPERGAGYLNKVYTWLKTGQRFRPSFPRTVELQTLSVCNAKCAFCPHALSPELIPHGRMEDGLIDKIVTECGRHMVGRISPYLTNEPLMDKRMPDILRLIRDKTPFFTKTKINTNAALLTEEVSRKILESGLSQIWFSVNGYSQETYRASMNLDYETSMRNIERFLELKKTLGKKRPSVKVTTIRTKLVEHELDYATRYWAERDVRFSIHHMDNRAGDAVSGIAAVEHQRKRNCDLFLKEVWNSKTFLDRIYEYYAGNFDNMEICRNCG